MSRRLGIRIGRGLTLVGGPLRTAPATGDLSDDELVAQLELALKVLAGRKPATLSIEVAKPRAQIRILAGLPHVPPAQLRQLVANHATRFFRIREEAVTDAVWLPARGGQRSALAAATPERLIERLCQVATTMGCPVGSVRPHSGPPELARLSLIPARLRVVKARRQQRAGRVAGSVAVLAWLAALGVSTLRVHDARLTAARELSDLRYRADSAISLRRELTSLHEARFLLETWEGEEGRLLAALARVAETLPATAHLTLLRAGEDGAMRLEGTAEDPGAVLNHLKEAPGVSEVQFTRPPVERLTVAGRSVTRFELGLKWRDQ